MKDLNETIEQYDLVVLGGGISGYTAAIHACQLGKKTALIEGNYLGGDYVHSGYFATLYMLKKAAFISECIQASSYGIFLGDLSVDLSKMLEDRKKKNTQMVTKIQSRLEEAGVVIYQGVGSVLPEHRVRITGDDNRVDIIGWKKLLIATGAHPIIPKMYRDVPGILTGRDVLNLTKRPDELVIIGGGFTACEIAAVFSMFGTKITMLHHNDRLIDDVEENALHAVEENLKKKQVRICYRTRVQEIYRDSAGNYHLEVQEADDSESVRTITAQNVMLALGKEANTLGLEALALNMKKNGIDVNSFLETSAKDVYAAGDVTAVSDLSHCARAMAYRAVENMFGSDVSEMDFTKIKKCLNTVPKIASIGMAESADETISGVGLTRNNSVKLTAEPVYGEIVQVDAIGSHAFDVVSQAEILMHMEATVDELQNAENGPFVDRGLYQAANQINRK